ncbi:DUF4863 family protein [Castellaniella sp. MT123]|uniref:4-hydroxylaminobenzoate lyase n=1 Tax=Castellaniella sp. MT123 TaxID=3140381 RepID=UPI0031F42268|nr:DUF4863 family protein [Castellaniella sp.]
MTHDTLLHLLQPVTRFIGGRPLDAALGEDLNRKFPAGGALYHQILTICLDGTRDGWVCAKEHGGIRYGRVIPPDAQLDGFSCDIVLMKNLVGPRHTHPSGEIDLNLPIDGNARFDDHPAGWLVYGPQTTHRPTVSSGESYVLYLLPNGEIDFH